MRCLPNAVLLAVLAAVVLAPPASARWIDEGKVGVLAHDIGFLGHHVEAGADINAELLFASPSLFAAVGAPRPHLGIAVNTAGATSYAYAGLTWSVDFLGTMFAGLGLGGAIHDGELTQDVPHRKKLGSRALFHESVELGYRVTQRISFSLFLDHISNADLAPRNAGITNFGLRAGIGF